PLTLLGMVSPFAVRLAADMVDTLGRTTGRLYAISTAGSLAGTLLTGFYLIPVFRVRTIFLGTAALLALPAIVFQLLAARRHLLAGVGVVALVVLAAAQPPASSVHVPMVRDTFFSPLKVYDGVRTRSLLSNNTYQAITHDGFTATGYPLLMVYLAWQAMPNATRALGVGLGAGIIPRLLATFGVEAHTIEIDPAVVEVA